MTPEIEAAIAEIKEAFPGSEVEVCPEPQGGVYVAVQNLTIGEQFIPSTSWIGFLITFQYPDADVYPHFVREDLRRASGQPLPVGITGPMTWQNRPALQVSRRSNRWTAGVDTAASKLAKVLSWLRTV
jgi:Prokaryotic E2 family E